MSVLAKPSTLDILPEMENVKIAYIVGKISGLPEEEAMDNFKRKADFLHKQGFLVYTPYEVFELSLAYYREERSADSQQEWLQAMDASFNFIFKLRSNQLLNNEDCELHALPNWKDSKGAQMEITLAQQIGMKVVLPPYNIIKKK